MPRQLHLAWAYAAMGDSARATALYSDVYREYQSAVRDRPGDWDRHMALGLAAAGLGLKDDGSRRGASHGRTFADRTRCLRRAGIPGVPGAIIRGCRRKRSGDRAAATADVTPGGPFDVVGVAQARSGVGSVAQRFALSETDRRWRSGSGPGSNQAMSKSFLNELKRRNVIRMAG